MKVFPAAVHEQHHPPGNRSVHTTQLLPPSPSHQTCHPLSQNKSRASVDFCMDTYRTRDTGLAQKVVFAPCPDHNTESQDFPTPPPAKGLPAAHVGSPRPIEAEQLQTHSPSRCSTSTTCGAPPPSRARHVLCV